MGKKVNHNPLWTGRFRLGSFGDADLGKGYNSAWLGRYYIGSFGDVDYGR